MWCWKAPLKRAHYYSYCFDVSTRPPHKVWMRVHPAVVSDQAVNYHVRTFDQSTCNQSPQVSASTTVVGVVFWNQLWHPEGTKSLANSPTHSGQSALQTTELANTKPNLVFYTSEPGPIETKNQLLQVSLRAMVDVVLNESIMETTM